MGIRSEELRLWNKLLFEPYVRKGQEKISRVVEVCELEAFKIVTKDIRGVLVFYLPDNEIKPIELTEEWLKRFGFKRYSQNTKFRHLGYYSLKYGNRLKIDYVEIHGKTSFHIRWTRKEIKYVHQLQNLYYALTGEELKEVAEKGNEILENPDMKNNWKTPDA